MANANTNPTTTKAEAPDASYIQNVLPIVYPSPDVKASVLTPWNKAEFLKAKAKAARKEGK